MIKRIKGILNAVILAAVNPLLRSTPAEPVTAEAVTPAPETPVPAKAPEERIKELEAELAGNGERMAALEKAAEEASGKAGLLNESLKQAVNAYRGLLINSNPDILPELISGDSLADLDKALAKARELTGKIKDNLNVQAQKARVPAGSPPRGTQDLSDLSSREKINRGVNSYKYK